MTGFPLAQIVGELPSSWVLLELWYVLPQAMLYWGCLCEPGAARLPCQGAEDGGQEPLQVPTTPQGTGPMAAWHSDQPLSAQVLGSGSTPAVCVPKDLKLRISQYLEPHVLSHLERRWCPGASSVAPISSGCRLCWLFPPHWLLGV